MQRWYKMAFMPRSHWSGISSDVVELDISLNLFVFVLQKHPFNLMYEERFVDVASYVCRILDQIPSSPISPMYVDWSQARCGVCLQWVVHPAFVILAVTCCSRVPKNKRKVQIPFCNDINLKKLFLHCKNPKSHHPSTGRKTWSSNVVLVKCIFAYDGIIRLSIYEILYLKLIQKNRNYQMKRCEAHHVRTNDVDNGSIRFHVQMNADRPTV